MMTHADLKQYQSTNRLSTTLSSSKSQYIKPYRNISPHQSSQDKSISRIRSLAKQLRILQNTYKQNLHDKYRQASKPNFQPKITKLREMITKEKKSQIPEQIVKNAKYKNIGSRHRQSNNNAIDLNYHQRLKKEIKQYQNCKKSVYRTEEEIAEQSINGIFKHAEQMKLKKMKYIERVNNERINNEKEMYLHKPQMVAKRMPNVEQINFEQRNLLASTRKIFKCNSLIKQAFQSYTFNPKTNDYKRIPSKIANIWKPQTINNAESMKNISKEEKQSKRFKSTTNTTSQINLNSVDEISFIFQ